MGGKHSTPVLRPEDVEALVKSTGMEEAQVINHVDDPSPNVLYNSNRFVKSLMSLSRKTQTVK